MRWISTDPGIWESGPYRIVQEGPERFQLRIRREWDKETIYETLRTLPTRELCQQVAEKREMG